MYFVYFQNTKILYLYLNISYFYFKYIFDVFVAISDKGDVSPTAARLNGEQIESQMLLFLLIRGVWGIEFIQEYFC